MNESELKQLMLDSGFLYESKVKDLDLDLALKNIIHSYGVPSPYPPYENNRHLFRTIRKDGKLVAHLGMLNVYDKVWMGHNHMSLDKGLGKEVFMDFAHWVAKNYGKKIDLLVSYYRPHNSGLYKKILEYVDDPDECWTTNISLDQQKKQVKDHAYGLNLSHLHIRDNIHYPAVFGEKVYTKWYFKCTMENIEKAFKYFIGEKK